MVHGYFIGNIELSLYSNFIEFIHSSAVQEYDICTYLDSMFQESRVNLAVILNVRPAGAEASILDRRCPNGSRDVVG
jgi:hypothetical protein